MRLFRPVSAAVAAGTLLAAAFTGMAGAQTAGVGTSLSQTKVLSAQLGNGSILDLGLVSEEARATTDKTVAAPGAYSRLTVASAATSLVPSSPINVLVPTPPYEAKDTGPTSVSVASSTLTAAAGNISQLAPVLAGTIDPGTLTATLTNGVAAAAQNAELANVSVVGGLVAINDVKSALTSTSAADNSNASRTASVSGVDLVNVGALLKGLGIDLNSLTVAQVSSLLSALGLSSTLPLPTGTTTLQGAVTTLSGLITTVSNSLTIVGGTVTGVTSVLDPTTTSLLGTVGITDPAPSTTGTTTTLITQAQTLLNDLNAQLASLLSTAVTTLADSPLVRIEGANVGVTTKAVDTVAGSVASVTGTIGAIKVGGVALPGLPIDLATQAAALSGIVTSVNNTVSSTLGLVSPDLANLVKVAVLDQATSITQSGGYTRARAGITAASVTITPPATLSSIVSTLSAQAGSIGSTITAAGGSLPVVGVAMSQLTSALSLGFGALTQPASVKAGQVLSASDFAAAGAATGTPASSSELPRTGGTTGLALAGAFAAALAVSLRRWMRRPELKPVRIKK